ncbi:hypothetical protein [Terasakiella pusilla]|uniref:hypothetical protein n=1 Tax=Terasakiella pusilla TaxID=64973 RepID=UPI00048F0ED1|nr:hypothetical protein [Terasakiella pusilla]
MKKLLSALTLAAILLANGAAVAGGTAYQVRVYCKGQPMWETVITAQAAGAAQNIAERQNPGCKAVVIGVAK